MRILHISTRLILGGSQENTVLSCEGQLRAGHEVHLAYGPIYGPEGSMLDRARTYRSDDGRAIGLHEISDLVREVSPVRDWRCMGQLGALVNRLRPDVVHTHSSKAGILGRLAAWRIHRSGANDGLPAVVHTIHGPPFMPVEGGLARRAKIRLNNLIYTVAERFAARRCHRIVSVADAMTDQFLARGIGSPPLFTTVRSGIDLRPYEQVDTADAKARAQRELGIPSGRFVVGTVARLAEHKGHADVLAALQRLEHDPEIHWSGESESSAPAIPGGPTASPPASSKQGRDVGNAILLWVGDGWLRERLTRIRDDEPGARCNVVELDRFTSVAEAWAKGHHDSHRPTIVLTGLVPPECVPGLMRAMDVLVHPSSREGLPRTVPQALLCGVCPVAYDVDGTREICVPGQTGVLVPHGDVGALSEALAWCYSHRAEREALAAAGRDRVRVEFSTDAMLEGLERVYLSAIAKATGRA